MNSDKQRLILEAAAKACGIEATGYHHKFGIKHTAGSDYFPRTEYWNPYTRPEDCAEMCAELGIETRYYERPIDFVACSEGKLSVSIETKDHDNSRLKAWMAAATMIAAKIGGY